jgi:multiple sugar transport system substrate-binding protein
MWHGLFQIPGAPIIPKDTNINKQFTDGQVAMISGYTGTLPVLAQVKDHDWDVTTYPANPKNPGVGQRVDSLVMTISSTSAHKDEAFKVLSVALSDEVQTDLSRNAQMSVLKDRNVQEQFGKAFAGMIRKMCSL